MVKRKLAPGGVFVTQSGPAGVLSATQARFLQLSVRAHSKTSNNALSLQIVTLRGPDQASNCVAAPC